MAAAAARRRLVTILALGAAAELAVNAPFAWVLDPEDHQGAPGAVGALVGVLVAIAAGPWLGAAVALLGSGLFYVIVAESSAGSVLAFPAWIGAALAAGFLAERLRATERQARFEAEERARASLALAHVAEGVFLLDREGVVQFWNPAAAAITGIRESDAVGRPVEAVLPGWNEIDELVPLVASQDVAQSGAQTVPLEVREGERWLLFSAARFEEGRVYAFRDVTDERGLRTLQAEFVATASHELRTPLAAVYGAAMTLRRPGLSEEDRAHLLAVIVDQADRLARIIDDVLWTSRLDSGRLEVAIERCDGVELARRVVEGAGAHTPAAIKVLLDADAGVPAVTADADKLHQVLVNLVDNAVKYSPEGGTVRVRVSGSDGGVCFSVRDEGLGIPFPEQQRIFEKFYRLDPQLTRGVGGTGLGLYICRELVQRMGGSIWVRSEEGSGSTFSVELPAHQEHVTAELRAAG
ncbi:MAG: PAS domain-containing protein [Thermoleophilia bacterium]|nr:PAS domain-containing protein [Thermoleophilia bacterium]